MEIKKENMLKILGLILAGVIIWYNTKVFYAYITGRITEEWYIIFMIVPLLVLIINYFIAIKLNKMKNNNSSH